MLKYSIVTQQPKCTKSKVLGRFTIPEVLSTHPWASWNWCCFSLPGIFLLFNYLTITEWGGRCPVWIGYHALYIITRVSHPNLACLWLPLQDLTYLRRWSHWSQDQEITLVFSTWMIFHRWICLWQTDFGIVYKGRRGKSNKMFL